jgi:hypothetical protein
MIDKDAIRLRWQVVGGKLDERGQRLFAAAEVVAAGYGGLKAVAEITGLARSTINVARTISTRNLCRWGGSGVPVADAKPLRRTILGSCPS